MIKAMSIAALSAFGVFLALLLIMTVDPVVADVAASQDNCSSEPGLAAGAGHCRDAFYADGAAYAIGGRKATRVPSIRADRPGFEWRRFDCIGMRPIAARFASSGGMVSVGRDGQGRRAALAALGCVGRDDAFVGEAFGQVGDIPARIRFIVPDAPSGWRALPAT
jgi:hypothetical protein